jgi:hypothetical protein
LLVFDVQAIFVEPKGNPSSSQTTLGVNVKALNADIPVPIDNTCELQVAKDPSQSFRGNRAAQSSSQDSNWRQAIICSVAVCPVAGSIKQLNKCRVKVFNFGKGFGLHEFGIRQAPLHVELGLDGLITNDKFCLTRWGKLMLKADQRPQHRR